MGRLGFNLLVINFDPEHIDPRMVHPSVHHYWGLWEKNCAMISPTNLRIEPFEILCVHWHLFNTEGPLLFVCDMANSLSTICRGERWGGGLLASRLVVEVKEQVRLKMAIGGKTQKRVSPLCRSTSPPVVLRRSAGSEGARGRKTAFQGAPVSSSPPLLKCHLALRSPGSLACQRPRESS